MRLALRRTPNDMLDRTSASCSHPRVRDDVQARGTGGGAAVLAQQSLHSRLDAQSTARDNSSRLEQQVDNDNWSGER